MYYCKKYIKDLQNVHWLDKSQETKHTHFYKSLDFYSLFTYWLCL